MLFLQRIPRLLRWVFSVVVAFVITMTLLRFVFFWQYNPPGKPFSGSAFIMGFRFDIRFAAITGLAILLLCSVPFVNPFKNYNARKYWNCILPFLFISMLVFYGADYYHYDYLHQRLNASVLNYLQDAGISFDMMWQTYPLVKIFIALLVLGFAVRILFGKLLFKYQTIHQSDQRRGILFYLFSFLLLGMLAFGKIGQFPLRWSDAFTLNDDFKANLALNPFQSFFSSLKFKSTYDINQVKKYYPLLSAHLGVQQPDSNKLHFERNYIITDTFTRKPNIILIICESFSAYKSSMYGNPLNTTPYFNELCKNGIFFDRCFTPSYGTARGVWATITGIPDVESPKTASRNLNAVNQRTIINHFNGYERFYFLGGDPTWANIQGVLANNITGLHLYQQDDFKAKKIDVWGISDKNLFLEANEILKQQAKPFFAIIQTADNHRPYTIPAEDLGTFKNITVPNDSLYKYGFENNKELNAFRYTDFCYRQFMEAAEKETYFDNTIFVFIGDHGIRGNSADMFPKAWKEQGLTTVHVPLLFYAPKLLPAQRIHQVCSQVDVLPSVAGLAKISYTNTSLGRNLFDSTTTSSSLAFVFDEGLKTIGLINDDYFFYKNVTSGKNEIVSIKGNDAVPVTAITIQTKAFLAQLTDAYYETAKYLLFNNKKPE